MDSELIIYLVFLAIAFLSRFLTKKKEKQQGTPSNTGRRPKPAKSFEELLQEFTRPEQEENAPRPSTSQNRRAERREEPEEEEVETSFTFERQDRLKTIDELVDIENVRTKSKLASTEDEEEDLSELVTVKRMFEDPEDARKAIILSEILTRKYN